MSLKNKIYLVEVINLLLVRKVSGKEVVVDE